MGVKIYLSLTPIETHSSPSLNPTKLNLSSQDDEDD